MKAKHVLAISAAAFSVALAIVVGNRMSAEAMAVVIGVVCGVASSIPMSALILALSRRSRPQAEESRAADARLPFFVVSPALAGQGPVPMGHTPAPAQWPGYAPAYPLPAVPAPRQYHIVGDDPL